VNDLLAKLKRFYASYTPWISLGLGVLSRVLSHEGVDFAPKAVAILALGWLLPVGVARWLRPPAEGAREPRWRHFARTVSPTVTVLLYKNVLFFLVPVWFGSATFGSINIAVPLVLAAMALYTCFAHYFHDEVLAHPRLCVLWTAAILFAALVPATAVIALTSPRTSIVLSALVSSVVAWAALAPNESLLSRKGLLSLARVSLPATLVLGLATPLFPPVPMACHARGAGTAVSNRQLEGQARHFPRGTPKVFAWFAVTLPERDRQSIAFQWYHDDEKAGPPFHVTVEGGRRAGYRTWTARSTPGPGSWRVDLLTGRSSQLIGRTSFVVDR
jgi:Protein of unknown function (DUF2914).